MTDVIIPIKDLSKAKSRLMGVLTSQQRMDLVLAMLHDLLTTLRSTDVRNIWLVATDDAVLYVGARFGVTPVKEHVVKGYNHAVSIGLSQIDKGTPTVILPGDLPRATAVDLRALTKSDLRPGIRIVPDHQNRGTNGLYLSSPDLIGPGFGENSFFRHCARANQIGLHAKVMPLESLAPDLDTAGDLYALACASIGKATRTVIAGITAAEAQSHQHNREAI